ncbi:unnamed protein product [Linum trigynum]|uniref:Uncharacterized protein n=1 Tax=Linum trigynum TaxID=586398 RepID=A0AAV2F5U9_9ROSI
MAVPRTLKLARRLVRERKQMANDISQTVVKKLKEEKADSILSIFYERAKTSFFFGGTLVSLSCLAYWEGKTTELLTAALLEENLSGKQYGRERLKA